MATIDDLLVELGFEYDPEDLDNFRDGIEETVGLVKQLAKVVTVAATAITAMVVASTFASDEQGKLADEIGLTVEAIDALQFANRRAGGSAEGMSASLRQLAITSAEAARGVGGGIEAFGILGISVTDANGQLRSTTDILFDVSKQLQGLDRARQIELASKLGLDDPLKLLQQGPENIRALILEAEQLGVTTGEDAALAAEFQDSLVDLWQIVKQVTRTLTRELVPIMEEAVNVFTEWWKSNREIIEQNIPAFLEKLTFAMKVLGAATAAFIALKFAALIGSLPTLFAAAIVWVNGFLASILALPVLIGAAVAAIGLLANDATGFFEGQDSFIGDMLKKYPEWGTELRSVAAIFATISDLTENIFEGWRKILDLDFSFEGLEEVGKFLPGFLQEQIDPDLGENILGFLGDLTGLSPLAQRATVPGLSSVTNNRGGMRVDKIEIIVPDAGSPEATARAVMNQFQQASQDLASAVDQ